MITPEVAYRVALGKLLKCSELSQDFIAKEAGISQGQLSKIRSGDIRGRLDQMVDIARALGTTLDEMITIGYKELSTPIPKHIKRADPPREITKLIEQLDPQGIESTKAHIETYLRLKRERETDNVTLLNDNARIYELIQMVIRAATSESREFDSKNMDAEALKKLFTDFLKKDTEQKQTVNKK